MITKKCLQCGKEFEKSIFCSKKSWISVRFCSRLCKQKSPIVREKTKNSNIGKHTEKRKPCSEKTKLKISQSNTGKKRTDEQKKRIGQSGLGRTAWNKNKKCQYVTDRNLTNNPCKRGPEHPNWKDGKSFELYGFDFTEELRTLIRKRDKFTCHFCKKNGFCVHHIDYNKKNNNPTNLITLCRSCHTKTNWNRPKWLDYFTRYLTLN